MNSGDFLRRLSVCASKAFTIKMYYILNRWWPLNTNKCSISFNFTNWFTWNYLEGVNKKRLLFTRCHVFIQRYKKMIIHKLLTNYIYYCVNFEKSIFWWMYLTHKFSRITFGNCSRPFIHGWKSIIFLWIM